MSTEQGPKPEIQRWEYYTFVRSRGINGLLAGFSVQEWNDAPDLKRLGEEGWELVSISAQSSMGGQPFAGITSDEMWVFKRPIRQTYRSVLQSPENIEIRRFSQKAKEMLEKRGYVIYELQGKSMEELYGKKGEPIPQPEIRGTQLDEWKTAPFWTETTPPTEVAINPNQIFLPDSNDKGFKLQQKMVEAFSKETSTDINGVKAVIGEVANYVELALIYRDDAGEKLFGEDQYAITKTRYGAGPFKGCLTNVGERKEGMVCFVSKLAEEGGSHYDWIMPLIVPS